MKVKLEKREYDDRQLRPSVSKRSKLCGTTLSSPQSNKYAFEKNELPAPNSVNDLLDEPSPIGLQLKKSPSFLELIQMRLSSDASSMAAAIPQCTEKTKASNFAASLLRIGSWEFVSRYSGDLVSKCYYAKHKLVWEILQGGLKNKIEIQWSDIIALHVNCPDGGPGMMTIALSRPPMFYRESEPQPRKHTLWQRSSDFTNGQASIYVKHYLEFPPGVLDKHYEKLIQCDSRLKHLSQQPKMVLESMLFFTQDSLIEGSDEPIARFSSGKSCFSDDFSPSSLNHEQMDSGSSIFSREAVASPSTVLGTYGNEEICNKWKHFDSGVVVHQSMSMTDLVNHIVENHISKDKAPECEHVLENISEVLLSDTHNNSTTSSFSDEKSLMKRVNSLFNLLHEDPATQVMQVSSTPYSLQHVNDFNGFCNERDDFSYFRDNGCYETSPANVTKETPTISRKDSFGDLLLFQLPRIASLSKLLCDISEDDKSEAN